MKIYCPFPYSQINQGFGKANTIPSVLYIYQSYGLLGHDGWDFGVKCKGSLTAKHGNQCEPIYCNVEGDGELTVVGLQKDDTKGYGLTVMDEKWTKFLWWHEDTFDPLIVMGAKIKPGQRIGLAGNTGISTGAHVHFGFYPYGADYNNGYHGAEDPTPYYDNRFVLDIEKQMGIIRQLIDLYKQVMNMIK